MTKDKIQIREGKRGIVGDLLMLGEYRPKIQEIILYRDAIEKFAAEKGLSFCSVLSHALLHEVGHAVEASS